LTVRRRVETGSIGFKRGTNLGSQEEKGVAI